MQLIYINKHILGITSLQFANVLACCNMRKTYLPRICWPSCFDLPRPNLFNLGHFGRNGKHLVKFSSPKLIAELKFPSVKSIFLGL